MHQLRKAQRCPGCGTHPDDWDPARGGAVDAFVADLDVCRGCASLEKERAELDKARERGNVRPGTTVRLRPFDPDTDDLGPEADHG